MFSLEDTIVAIATPSGRGGIGVIRLSGPDAHVIAQRLTRRTAAFQPRHATLTTVRTTPEPIGGASSAALAERLEDDSDEAIGRGEAERPHGAQASARVSPDVIDQAVVTYFPAPASYTGDDVVEVSAHGSPVVLNAIVSSAMSHGARLAEPGEFTLRAYLNGRMDLTQAEAVADLVEAVTPLQARAAFDQLQGTLTQRIAGIDRALFDLIARLEASVDFPDEGYHFVDVESLAASIDRIRVQTGALLSDGRQGRLVREGLEVAIVGRPNVGKSSLFNALVGSARAIVTEVPGTTRDLVSETVDLHGFRLLLVDTAGIRATQNLVETEGVSRTLGAATVADLILLVLDGSQPGSLFELQDVTQVDDSKVLTVVNKADLPQVVDLTGGDAIRVSARTGAGLDTLRCRILRALHADLAADRPAITNLRHISLVQRAHDALGRAYRAAARGNSGGAMPEEFVLADLQEARASLEEITGKRAPEDLLAHIFARFCIGK
jgi:tRNA modification GTPase